MYNKNAAFDFKTLEERKVKRGNIVVLPGRRARQHEKSKNRKIILTSAFSIFFGVALGVSGFIVGQAKLTEITDAYSKASKQLEECKSTNTGLEMKLKELDGGSASVGFSENSTVEIVKVHKNDIARIQ